MCDGYIPRRGGLIVIFLRRSERRRSGLEASKIGSCVQNLMDFFVRACVVISGCVCENCGKHKSGRCGKLLIFSKK